MALSSECASEILGRLDPMTYLSLYPHSCVPCHNLQYGVFREGKRSIEYFSGFFSKLPYHVTCPVPASYPAALERNVINGIDPALQLVKAKKKWEDFKHRILKFCSSKMLVNDTVTSSKNYKLKEVPLNVLLLANHIRKDPDPHFNSNYNAYFNGSDITSLDLGIDKLLIRPKSFGKGEIVFSQLYLNDGQWDVNYENLTSSSTDKPGHIYQIEASSNVVLARQKQSISLFSLDDEGNGFSVQKKLTIKKDCPIFSVTTNGKSLCSFSAERDIEIFDVMVGSPVVQKKLFNDEDVMSDSWGSVYYVNNNTLTFLDRSSCNLIDLRVKADVLKKWPINSITEHCEEVYSGGMGNNELQYIVTSHQVLSLDLKSGFSQRWTHGIDHSPAVLSVLTPYSLNDVLFIGSQINDAVVLIENACIENKTSSKYHPYALPSLRDTFHLSQFNGYCLSNTVSSRFSMSLTGLCCVENEGTITLFRTTSVGDIFKQILTKCSSKEEEHQLSDRELNKIEDWESQCEELMLQQNNPCFVTDLLDDTNLLNCIQGEQVQYEEESFDKLDIDRAEWSVSKKELMSYCDYLAPRILEQWGIDDEEEWCLVPEKIFDELSSDDEENVTERVTKWIEKYAEEMATDSTIHKEQDYGHKTVAEGTENNSNADVNIDTFDKTPKDLEDDISSIEPSHQKLKNTTSTSRKKFISGF